MKQILGLDLGTNSIGWALINSDYSIDNFGTRIFPDKTSTIDLERNQQRSPQRLNTRIGIRKISKSSDIKLDLRFILGLSLTILMFAFAYLMIENWQFWLNLGIGGIFIILNMKTKKNN